MPMLVMGPGKRPSTMRVDVSDVKALKGLSIDDEVEITVKGKVKSISAPRKMGDDDDEKMPGDVVVEVGKQTVKKGGNVFTELDREDGEE